MWIVKFHHWCYSTISCKAAWSANVNFTSYWIIIDEAQTYRIPSDSLFITTLSIIETYPWAWECACIAHLYWNWYDAIGFVTLSLIQCIYVLKCRVIICLDNKFMNVRLQVPQHSSEQTQSFLSYPLNFSKPLMKFRKKFLKNSYTSELCEMSAICFGRNVLNTLVVGECNSVTWGKLGWVLPRLGIVCIWIEVLSCGTNSIGDFYCLRWVLLVNILQLCFVYKVCIICMT